MSFEIAGRQVGGGAPCLIIAEVGLAHGGDLGQAHAYIDAVADRGVDAVKFQCHLGDPVSEWRVHPDWDQDEDRQAYWKRTGFSHYEWTSLAVHAGEKGLIFLCSPFSVEAVKLLDPLVPAWKVPSGKVKDSEFLEELSRTGKPALISDGLASIGEAYAATKWFADSAFLHCCSLYPCPPEKVDLEFFRYWSEQIPIRGLSDHSGTIYAGLAAVALGCDVLEVHVCFSKEQGGFDTAASITMEQLGQLVKGVRFIEAAKTPVDKDKMAEELEPMRQVFMRKSVRRAAYDAKRTEAV